MSFNPEIPSEDILLNRKVTQEELFYLIEHEAIVKEITETGDNAGSIQVFCSDLSNGAEESNSENWLTAWPGSVLFSHVLPEIGDKIRITFPNGNSDRILYKAQNPFEYEFKKSGFGLNILFEFEDSTGSIFTLYYDKTNSKFVTEYGGIKTKHGNESIDIEVGSPTRKIKIDTQGITAMDNMDVKFLPSGRSALTDGYMTPLGPTISRIPGLHP
ncbi:hypothetical protein LEP1GSC168_0061 [Leptospira santarosai str. HAI134]|uniref:hypothetical protein n=1 Tax=Leptospira santarosai TaxID=28183 RepID=UPI0002C02312|nr:hypothetical protein [Leptospira santarosai]EMO20713.1 hypothetical protein LEP1GSC168_0061 [Leptospira santarosai str. HAI134]